MHRLLVVLLVIHMVACDRSWCQRHPNVCTHRHHDYHGTHEKDGDFHDLSWDLISLSRKAQRVCEREVNSTEIYEAANYKLSAILSNFNTEDITVKAKYRVLFIQAYKEGSDENVKSVLKIMPDIVDVKKGYWTFSDGLLQVYMPYTFNLGTEITKNCQTAIDESVITLPQQEIDLRFSEVTENAVQK